MLGHGIVGGCLTPVEDQGKRAGEIAMRVLRGERPGDIPFTGTEMNRYMFDSRQLRRWGIREQTLPEGSQIVYREPSLWKEYCAYIVTGAAAILLQSLLIAVLLLNRKKRLVCRRCAGGPVAVRDHACRSVVSFCRYYAGDRTS